MGSAPALWISRSVTKNDPCAPRATAAAGTSVRLPVSALPVHPAAGPVSHGLYATDPVPVLWMLSPAPGPRPDGPLAAPHQLSVKGRSSVDPSWASPIALLATQLSVEVVSSDAVFRTRMPRLVDSMRLRAITWC